MRLFQRITADGRYLFRLRSIVPLALLPLGIIALNKLAQLELRWGEGVEDVWLGFCLAVSAVGFVLRCLTVGFTPNGTSGRSTTAPSAVTLNTAGMYSIVRNPLYLANGIIWLGVALSTASGWFTAVTVLAYWLYIERVISAEEVFLDEQFGERYRAWVAQTPCFLPRLSQWLPPDRPFSLRAVVRREYHCVVAVASAFTFVELVSDVFLEGEPFQSWLVTDSGWVVFFCSALAFGAVIRTAKKQHWLDDVDTKKDMPTSP